MAEHVLKNDELQIRVSDHGAELRSLTKAGTGKEFMFQADPKYWGRTSPVLFPIVGGLWENKYVYNNKTYELPKHGFARDMDFKLVKESDDELIFELKDTEDTLKVYPFKFSLKIGYKLNGSKVSITYNVINENDDVMYFSIGAHPAFICDLNTDKLVFEKDGASVEGKLQSNVIDMSSGCLSEKVIDIKTEGGVLTLEPELFDEDALILEKRQADSVTIIRKNDEDKIKVSFDAPLFGVWSPDKKNAPFVCIEPWNGRCDRVGFSHILEEREYGNKLNVGESFKSTFSVEIIR